MMLNRPVVVLCGSTRFKKEFEGANARFTLAGRIVLSVGWFGHGNHREPTIQEKAKLDELHMDKIRLADEVYVVNPDGYIGESTASEIRFAYSIGKPVFSLERIVLPCCLTW